MPAKQWELKSTRISEHRINSRDFTDWVERQRQRDRECHTSHVNTADSVESVKSVKSGEAMSDTFITGSVKRLTFSIISIVSALIGSNPSRLPSRSPSKTNSKPFNASQHIIYSLRRSHSTGQKCRLSEQTVWSALSRCSRVQVE